MNDINGNTFVTLALFHAKRVTSFFHRMPPREEDTSVTIPRSFIFAYLRNIITIRTTIRTTMITAMTAPTTAPAFPLLDPLLCVAVEVGSEFDLEVGSGFDVEVKKLERTLDPLNEP